MSAPSLNRKLVLENANRVSDNAGGFTEVWESVGTLWGSMAARSGRERIGGNMTLSSVPYTITVRAAPMDAPSRPRPDQRFRMGSRIFRIVAVADDDAAAAYLNCYCTEEVTG